jgi:hypothetical protein
MRGPLGTERHWWIRAAVNSAVNFDTYSDTGSGHSGCPDGQRAH